MQEIARTNEVFHLRALLNEAQWFNNIIKTPSDFITDFLQKDPSFFI